LRKAERLRRQSCAACLSHLLLSFGNRMTEHQTRGVGGARRMADDIQQFQLGIYKEHGHPGGQENIELGVSGKTRIGKPSLPQAVVNQLRSLRIDSTHGQVKGLTGGAEVLSDRYRTAPAGVGPSEARPHSWQRACQPRNRVKLLQIAGLTRWACSRTRPLRPAPIPRSLTVDFSPCFCHPGLPPYHFTHAAAIKKHCHCHDPCSTAFFSPQSASSASVSVFLAYTSPRARSTATHPGHLGFSYRAQAHGLD